MYPRFQCGITALFETKFRSIRTKSSYRGGGHNFILPAKSILIIALKIDRPYSIEIKQDILLDILLYSSRWARPSSLRSPSYIVVGAKRLLTRTGNDGHAKAGAKTEREKYSSRETSVENLFVLAAEFSLPASSWCRCTQQTYDVGRSQLGPLENLLRVNQRQLALINEHFFKKY